MDGVVIKTTGKEFFVRTKDGSVVSCSVKGNFRIKGIKSTNPLVVGDRVAFNDAGLITTLYDRRNYIVRRPTNLSKQLHIIAANIDLAVLVVTVKNPETSTVFIDRFLATAEAYGVPTLLVFNKVDLLDEDELRYLDALEYLYSSIGYKCVRVAALSGFNVDVLCNELQGKITLFSGNSGVGKSTLINSIAPGVEAKTGEISNVHLKGMHTTTFSQMYAIDSESYIIDTPGIKGFGVVDMQVAEIGHYFPEIFRTSSKCRFANCTHRNEPGCAVIEAVEQSLIAQSRYASYRSIMDDVNEEKYR